MPGMTGRALLSAVTCGLLLAFGMSEPTRAGRAQAIQEPSRDDAQRPQALALGVDQNTTDVHADGAETARSYRLSDRVIDPSCFCRIYRERPNILRVLEDIGQVADLAMGIETVPDPVPDRSPRRYPDYVWYAGMTVGEALDLAVALDGNRYQWLETRDMIIVRPVFAWMDNEHYLTEVRGSFVLEDQLLYEAMWEMEGFFDPEFQSLYPHPFYVSDVGMTFALAGATLFDALNAVVKVHGDAYWTISYWWCSDSFLRRPCFRRWEAGDVMFSAQVNLYEGKGIGFSGRVPKPVVVPETSVQWPFWPRRPTSERLRSRMTRD